jgi:hypothetical protein
LVRDENIQISVGPLGIILNQISSSERGKGESSGNTVIRSAVVCQKALEEVVQNNVFSPRYTYEAQELLLNVDKVSTNNFGNDAIFPLLDHGSEESRHEPQIVDVNNARESIVNKQFPNFSIASRQ